MLEHQHDASHRVKRRVAILANAYMGWGGGIDLIVYIINALALNTHIQIYVFLSDNGEPFDLPVTMPLRSMSLRRILSRFLPRTTSPKSSTDPAIAAMLKRLDSNVKVIHCQKRQTDFLYQLARHKIDVALPAMTSLGPHFPIAWVGYIWDFQHKYIPSNFAETDITHRDSVFLRTLTDAHTVIVNAKEIKNDVKKFFPQFKQTNKVIALPFAPAPQKDWLNTKPGVQKKYNLPARYYLISNQFWAHKGHDTAIKAFAALHKSPAYEDTHLVCTGKPEDTRHPEYTASLRKLIKQHGLDDFVHILGYIPKEDQIAILQKSIAVVQPTHYEGGPGGGVAYNAVALGVPLILSDIPINKEISDPNTIFFKTGSSESLAKAMKTVARQKPKRRSAATLLSNGQERQLELAHVLSDCIERAIANFNSFSKKP